MFMYASQQLVCWPVCIYSLAVSLFSRLLLPYLGDWYQGSFIQFFLTVRNCMHIKCEDGH